MPDCLAGNGNETLYFGAALAGKHADERAFAMSGHCDAGEAFVFGKKVYPARHIVYIILEAEFGLFFACCGAAGYAAFVETERGDAFLCQSLGKEFQRIVFIMGLLPSMSVGPEPAISSTTGQVVALAGRRSLPLMSPVAVLNVTGLSSDVRGCAWQ